MAETTPALAHPRLVGAGTHAIELCQLFREYWAGLLTGFLGKSYSCDVRTIGSSCQMKLKPRAQ